ncbi:BatD family protein [Aureispira anguillae]|uniref:BatD family protein n=1 Tax=Aureispira anguillae TaxID=2864201 RepID=A0A915YJM6_9BACT|nr:BatD family protein [Aureispira anguillae]BDS14280.1 BatD family protein [Aureispira anguillae]
MKNQVFLILLGLLTGFSSFAQQDKVSSFYVETYDTVGLEEQFEIKFTLKNTKAIARFEAPSFEGFQVVAGPMTSQSMSIINGDMTQSMTYTFILTPVDLGIYNISAASIETEMGMLVTNDIAIVVVESIDRPNYNNPLNNAFQDPFFNSPFFNDPFFNQGTNPRQGLDDMMKNFEDKLQALPPNYHYEYNPNQTPIKKPKKKEKVYKI